MATLEVCRSIATPVGRVRLHAVGDRLARVVILDTGEAADVGSCPPGTASGSEILMRAAAQLDEYFAGRRRSFELPLDLSGCPDFARRALELLRTVPYGETLTYGELARRVGAPHAARAVGRVMARNPLPIVIPCHRVVAAAGRLGGYSGGAGTCTKEWLLALERRGVPANYQYLQENTA